MTGIEDDYISIHDSYRFYFLTTPVVGAFACFLTRIGESDNAQTAVFVFLGQLFTFDYDPSSRSNHGYTLQRQSLGGYKVQPRDIIVTRDQLAIQSEVSSNMGVNKSVEWNLLFWAIYSGTAFKRVLGAILRIHWLRSRVLTGYDCRAWLCSGFNVSRMEDWQDLESWSGALSSRKRYSYNDLLQFSFG